MPHPFHSVIVKRVGGHESLRLRKSPKNFVSGAEPTLLPGLVSHRRQGGLVGVARIGVADLGLGLRQLRLS